GGNDLVRAVVDALLAVWQGGQVEIDLGLCLNGDVLRPLDHIAVLVGCLDGTREGAGFSRRSRHGVAGRGQAIGKTGEFKGEAGAAGSSDLVRTVINALFAVGKGRQVEIDDWCNRKGILPPAIGAGIFSPKAFAVSCTQPERVCSSSGRRT